MAAGAPPLPPYVVHTGPFPLSHYDEVNNRFIILIQQQPLSAAAEALSSVHPNAVARLNAWTLLLQPVVAQWLLTRPPVTRVATSQLIEFAKPSGAVANGSGMGVFAWRNNGMISRCVFASRECSKWPSPSFNRPVLPLDDHIIYVRVDTYLLARSYRYANGCYVRLDDPERP